MKDNFIIDLLASLQKSKSKQQIKNDVKSLGDIYVKLIGSLDMAKTRKNIKNQLKGFNLNGKSFTITPTINTKGVQNAAKQAVNNAQKVANSNSVQLRFDTDKQKLLNQIKILGRNNSKLFNNSDMTAKYNQLLNSANIAKSKTELNALRGQLSAFRTELIATNNAGLTWGDKFKASISRYTQLFSGASFVYTMANQLRNAWTEAKTLDDRLVDLQKVTDEIANRDSLYKYFDKAMNKAQDLNVKVDSLIYAITEFKKLGWSLSDAELGGEWATILENVGDISIDTAIGSIKTAIASFDEIGGYTDMQMDKKLEAYTDLINNMSNKYSIDAEGLAEAIRLSAGTLTEAHTSIEQAATMFATANKYYNDPSYLGHTVKIGSLRMRASEGDNDAIAELEDMGEEIDNLAEATSNLREKLMALTGVDIMIDEHTFKSYYDQLFEISQVIDDLNDTSRANVLETLFGKNRSAAGAAILLGMKESADAYKDAINSAGSATEEYDKWMQSASAASQRFANNLTKTYQSIIGGNTVRDLANIGSAVLEFANNWGIVEGTFKGLLVLGVGKFLTSTTMAMISATKSVEQYGRALQLANNIPDGNLATRFTTLKSIAAMTDTLTSAQLKQVLSSQALTQQDRIRILQMSGMTKEMALQKLAEMGLTQATNAQTAANAASTASTFSLKAAMAGLGATIKGIVASNPVGITLMAVSLGVSAVTSAISSHNQKMEEMRDKAKEAADKANTLGDEIADLANKYISLSEAIRTDVIAKEDLMTAQTELLKKLGLEGESVEELVSQYGSLSNAIQQVSIDSLQNARIDLLSGVSVAKEELLEIGKDGFWGGNNIISATGDDAVKAFKELEKSGVVSNSAYGTAGGSLVLVGDDTTTEGILQNYERLEKGLATLRDSDVFTAEELSDNSLYQAMYARYNEMSEAVNSYKSAIEELNENVAQETMLTALQGQEIPKTEETFNTFKQELIDTAVASGQFIGNEKEITDAINNYLSSVPEFKGFYSIPLENELDKVNTLLGQEDFSKIFTSFTEEQSKSIDDFQSKIKTLSTTLSNLRDGSYQESDFVDLIQEFPELQDKSENLEKAIIELINKSINELYNTIGKNLPDNVKNSLQSIADEAINVGKAIDSIKDLSTALGDLDSAHGLLETLKDDIETNNSISISSLKKIIDMYPELTDKVVEYQTGLLSVEELYDSFDGMYKKDLHNYSLYLAEKNGENETWYKNIVDGLSDELKSKAKYYGIDLDNYSNYQKAKLEIDKKYAQMHTELEQKKLDLERQNIVKESAKKKYISTVRDADQGRRINPSIDTFDEIIEAEDNIEELTSIVGTAQKELDEYSKFLEEFDTSIAFSFDFDDMFKGSDSSKSSTSTSTSDFSNQIDWAAQSIDILERKVSRLQTTLDNTKGYKAQISLINKLVKEQGRLVSGYEKAQKTYQSKYNDVLTTGVIAKNGLSNKIRSQIENGESFNIEDFIDKNVSSDNTGIREQLYDAINDAIDWYNKSNDAQDNVVKIRAEINEASFTKLGLQIEEWEKQVELSKDKIDLYTENLSVQTDFNSKLVEQEKKRYSLLIQQARKEKDYTKAKQLEVEQQKTLLELTKEQFDRINNYYDNKLGSLNSKTSKMNTAMSLVEAQGSSAGIGYYKRLNNINEYSIDYLETERDKLRESLSTIKIYTDEWYNALKTLNDVEEQIIELNTGIEENNNKIKQMNWDRFDQLSDKIQSLNDERDFIDDLLGSYEKIDEKTGKLTSYGVSSNALHLANYDTYMYNAEQLANEIASLDAEYADDKNNSFYLEQRDNLISQRYDAIRAAQSERETVIDLIKDGINAEISATEKLVNAKKEALSAEQELHDYQKSIAEKTNDINMIQRQINALEGDDSLENQKKLRELRSQLKDTKDDLEETQYDHSISEQQDALDKMLDDYKASMEEYMKNTDALLAKSIAQVNVESGNVADTLKEVTGNIGYDISNNVIEPWKESSDVISNYKTTFESASASTLTNLGLMKTAWKELNDQIDKYSKDATSALYSEDKADHIIGKGGNTSNTTNIDKNALSGKDSSGSYKKNTSSNDKKDNDTLSKVKQICASASAKSDGNAGTEINKYILAHQSELGGNGNKLTWKQMVNLADVLGIKTDISKVSDTTEIGKSVRKEILKKLKSVTGFSTGGIVKVMGNDDGLVKLKAGETVLTDAFTSILPEAVNVMKNFTLDIPNIMKNVQFVNPVQKFMQRPISVGDITIQLDGSNVIDAKTFSDCLNKNKEYIQHMVWDVPLGRGELNYNKYKRV